MSRSRNLPVVTMYTNVVFPPATIPLRPTKMANTHTASTMNIGVPTQRRCHSTFMVSFTFQNQRRLRIPWRRRVSSYEGTPEEILADNFAVRTMAELASQVKDEQSYIVVRERTHRNTAESTNSRIKWWSIFQLIIIAGQGVFQVWWLKRFFEVRHQTFFFLKIFRVY